MKGFVARLISFSVFPVAVLLADDATITVTINGGSLALSGVAGQTPTDSSLVVSASTQTASVTLTGIGVEDLDGNGNGWDLSVTPPANLTHTDAVTTIAIASSYTGLNNPSDGTYLNMLTVNSAEWTDGGGVSGWSCDYTVDYDVGAYPKTGDYTGTLTITLTSK